MFYIAMKWIGAMILLASVLLLASFLLVKYAEVDKEEMTLYAKIISSAIAFYCIGSLGSEDERRKLK